MISLFVKVKITLKESIWQKHQVQQTKFGVGITVHKDDGVTINCVSQFTLRDKNKPLGDSPLSKSEFTSYDIFPVQNESIFVFDLFDYHNYLKKIVYANIPKL